MRLSAHHTQHQLAACERSNLWCGHESPSQTRTAVFWPGLSPVAAISRDVGQVRCMGSDVPHRSLELRAGARTMQRQESDFEGRMDDDQNDVAWPNSPEENIDRFGIRTALFVLCVALFIASMWLVSRPSFEKCSALENVTERNACFDTLRNDFLKPPAKGADIPKG